MGSISISPFQLSNARQIKSVLVHNQWFSHNSHLAKCCWRSTISPCSRTENLFTATGCHAVHYEDTLRYFPTCKRTPKPSAHIGCIKFQVGSMLRHFFSQREICWQCLVARRENFQAERKFHKLISPVKLYFLLHTHFNTYKSCGQQSSWLSKLDGLFTCSRKRSSLE